MYSAEQFLGAGFKRPNKNRNTEGSCGDDPRQNRDATDHLSVARLRVGPRSVHKRGSRSREEFYPEQHSVYPVRDPEDETALRHVRDHAEKLVFASVV